MDSSDSCSDGGREEVSDENQLPLVPRTGSVYMTISTIEKSSFALGNFDLKYFPLRSLIKERILADQEDNISSVNSQPHQNRNSDDKKRNVYEIIQNYYGQENIQTIVKENLINKQRYEYLQSYTELK